MAETPIIEPHGRGPWDISEPAAGPSLAPAAVRAGSPRSTFAWGLVSTLLLAGWIALWVNWLAAVALVGGVFVHEFGHLLVINWAGAGPSRIRISIIPTRRSPHRRNRYRCAWRWPQT